MEKVPNGENQRATCLAPLLYVPVTEKQDYTVFGSLFLLQAKNLIAVVH